MLQPLHLSDERWANYLLVLEARDLSTSPGRLMELAEHPARVVRRYVAVAPGTQPEVLGRLLLTDDDSSTRWVLLLNPNVPTWALAELGERLRRDSEGRQTIDLHAIADHPQAPPGYERYCLEATFCRRRGRA